MKVGFLYGRYRVAVTLLCVLVSASCGIGAAVPARDEALGENESSGGQATQQGPQLVIENDSDLPSTYPYGRYQVHFLARGGTAPLHWRVTFGQLPPGMRLEDDGSLHGQAEKPGEFNFSVSVTDSSLDRVQAHKSFTIRVKSDFTLEWKTPAHVNGNRIEGSVEVSNTTPDDIDLTFVVLAVAGDGRATAIGYQHFVLPRATLVQELPFGESLPHGTYDIHVDAVGEVESKKLILRHRLQSSHALQVIVGP